MQRTVWHAGTPNLGPGVAGAGTVNRTPPYRALIRTISINGTRNISDDKAYYGEMEDIVKAFGSVINVFTHEQDIRGYQGYFYKNGFLTTSY